MRRSRSPLALRKGAGDAVADEAVLLAVGSGQALGGAGGGHFAHGGLIRLVGQAGVEAAQGGAQVAGQDDFAVVGPAEQAIRPEGLTVPGQRRLPAELVTQIVGRGLLDEGVFVIARHSLLLLCYSCRGQTNLSKNALFRILAESNRPSNEMTSTYALRFFL